MVQAQQQVVNVAEGKELNQSLGFVANSVTINNITQSWAYIPAAQRFIPPYHYGVVVQIPGTDIADITWQTPTSLPVGPVGTGTLAANYTTDNLPPSNGVSVFSQQVQVILGTVGPGGAVGFTLPAGCQALLIALEGSTANVSVIQVTGLTTGALYGVANLSNTGQVAVIVPVSALADPRVQVSNGSALTALVLALFTSEPEPPPQVQPVSLVGTGGVTVPFLVQPVANQQQYVPVLQRPTFKIFAGRINMAVAGQILIAAPGVGFSIVIRKVRVTTSVAGAAGSYIRLGTTLAGLDLGQWEVINIGEYFLDMDDYLVGDNLPVDVSGSVAFTSTSWVVTYSVVATAAWPIG